MVVMPPAYRQVGTQQEIADFLGIGQSRLAKMEYFMKFGNIANFHKTNENSDALSVSAILPKPIKLETIQTLYQNWQSCQN